VIVQLYVLDERFQLYCGINWCFMHQATIGLFGHLVKAVIYKVEITLRNDSYVQGKTREGDPKLFISMPAFDGVWTRLCRRLTHVRSDVSGLQLTPKHAAHIRKVYRQQEHVHCWPPGTAHDGAALYVSGSYRARAEINRACNRRKQNR
jgi:hypothetical protein